MSRELERRADQLVGEIAEHERQKKRDAYEQLMQLVDAGELTVEAVDSIMRTVGAVAVVATYPGGPYRVQQIKKLERGIDEAGGA